MEKSIIHQLFMPAHAVSAVVPPRTGEKVFLHFMSEVGELAEEASIHAGELYKSPGTDGVVGEACDVINCLADMVWVRLNSSPAATQADVMEAFGLAPEKETAENVPVLPFTEAKALFAKTISDMKMVHSLATEVGSISHEERQVTFDIISAVLILAQSARPSLTRAEFLEMYQAKCDKWHSKAMGASIADEPPINEDEFKTFQATRREMGSRKFGDLIGDAMWEDEPEVPFLVYDDAWWIEKTKESEYVLILGNRSWITGPDKTLEDLERELFRFTKIS
jgi:hypothetical protein